MRARALTTLLCLLFEYQEKIAERLIIKFPMGNLFSSCLFSLKAFGHTTPRVCMYKHAGQCTKFSDSRRSETTSKLFNGRLIEDYRN